MDEISEIESIVSIKANPTVTEEKKFMEKTVNKKLGAGLADVLFSLGDDDLDTLNDDCKYSYDMDHLIWTILCGPYDMDHMILVTKNEFR